MAIQTSCRTPLMGEMEEVSERCGKVSWNGRIKIPGRRKRSRTGSPGLVSGESHRAGQSSSGLGLGNENLKFSCKDIAFAVRVFRAQAACSV